MKRRRHWTLAEAHEALKKLREPLDVDPLVEQAYEKSLPARCTPAPRPKDDR